jgi:hypothetical protein
MAEIILPGPSRALGTRFLDFGGTKNTVRAGRKQSKAALRGALRRRPH